MRPNKPKRQLSMAATARVIWLCAWLRYWPDRGLVFDCVTCFYCFFIQRSNLVPRAFVRPQAREKALGTRLLRHGSHLCVMFWTFFLNLVLFFLKILASNSLFLCKMIFSENLLNLSGSTRVVFPIHFNPNNSLLIILQISLLFRFIPALIL